MPSMTCAPSSNHSELDGALRDEVQQRRRPDRAAAEIVEAGERERHRQRQQRRRGRDGSRHVREQQQVHRNERRHGQPGRAPEAALPAQVAEQVAAEQALLGDPALREQPGHQQRPVVIHRHRRGGRAREQREVHQHDRADRQRHDHRTSPPAARTQTPRRKYWPARPRAAWETAAVPPARWSLRSAPRRAALPARACSPPAPPYGRAPRTRRRARPAVGGGAFPAC